MFFVLSRKKIISALALIITVIASCCMISTDNVATIYFNKSIRKVPIYNVKTEEKIVALTFDAAWGADKTENIIKILMDNKVGGTFFLVGFWVDKYPELVKKIDSSGLDIGNHSKNHLNMPKLSNDQMNEELTYVNDEVYKLIGKKPKFFRAPFGDYSNEVIDIAKNNNLQPIQWDVDSLDWKGISSREIVSRVLNKVKNGSIILCHNNSDHILEALPVLILELKNRGFKMVNLSKLVYENDFTIDNNGTQIKIDGGTNGLRANEQ